MRTLVVWCPDWPVVAAELDGAVPAGHPSAAVLHNGRVVSTSPAARAVGVRRGLRRREAQARCPELAVIPADPDRDARTFEPVVAAVEAVAPGVEVVRPGVCAVASRGPAGYFGGEERAAERLTDAVSDAVAVECQVGAADGPFAAVLAARAGALVPPGEAAAFLAGLPIGVLDHPELVDVLRRLGIGTLGGFAALPAADVLTRFGFDAAHLHALAAGHDGRVLAARTPPPGLEVVAEPDPPVDRVDMAAFLARSLAERWHATLAGHGLAATRLGIEATTGAGEVRYRTWRHDGLLTVAAVADRVRWQLDGWLSGPDRPTAGIVRLRLVPEGLVAHAGMQLGLWGGSGEERDRAVRAMTRVQGLLGPEQVVTPVPGGGRGVPRMHQVPWGDDRALFRAGADRPWPGRLPAPTPPVLPAPGTDSGADPRTGREAWCGPVEVGGFDGEGGDEPVGVTGRHRMTAEPSWVAMPGAPPAEVTGWAGPWPLQERWWAPEGERRALLQVMLSDGTALLLSCSGGRWTVLGEYD